MKKALQILIHNSRLLLCLLGITVLLFLSGSGLNAATDEQDEDDVEYVSEYSLENAGADSYFKSTEYHPRRHHIIHSRRQTFQIYFNRQAYESGISRRAYTFLGQQNTYPDSYCFIPRPDYYTSLYRCAVF